LGYVRGRQVDMPKQNQTGRAVLLRGDTEHGFQLLDAMSHERLAGPNVSLQGALEAARQHGASAIWQEPVDNRGRPLGEPFRLFKPVA
jgi:hypothetical protein